MFERLQNGLEQGRCLITVATGELSDDEGERTGLVATHAYAVLDLKEIDVSVNTVSRDNTSTIFQIRLRAFRRVWSCYNWKIHGRICVGRATIPNWMRCIGRQNFRNCWDMIPLSQLRWIMAFFGSIIGRFWISSMFFTWIGIRPCFSTPTAYISKFQLFDDVARWILELPLISAAYIHRKWSAGVGPTKDAYTIGDNPQYKLSVGAGHGSIWVLLTRHITSIADFRENKEYITLLVYQNNGKRVYYPCEFYSVCASALSLTHFLTQTIRSHSLTVFASTVLTFCAR